MRRGWMDWVAQETPRELLLQRQRQVAAACARHGLDALVLYSGFTRPAQVSALSHFVPFWSEAVLVVTAAGRSLLAMATTGRTVQWIHTTSVVDEVRVGPEVGAVAARWLSEQGAPLRRIGVAGLDEIPQAVHAGLRSLPDEIGIEEVDGWFDPLAAQFMATPVVTQRALQIAQGALDSVAGARLADAHAVVAHLDRHCRGEGAEEVAVYLAPHLGRDAIFRRLEGPVPLGPTAAVQLTLAYKGYWMRLGGSFAQEDGACSELPASAAARAALAAADREGADLAQAAEAVRRQANCEPDTGLLEGVRGGLPLATLQVFGTTPAATVWPVGTSFTLVLRRRDGARLLVTHPKAAVQVA